MTKSRIDVEGQNKTIFGSKILCRILRAVGFVACENVLDWIEQSLTPQRTQYRSFRRRSSQPITWLLLTKSENVLPCVKQILVYCSKVCDERSLLTTFTHTDNNIQVSFFITKTFTHRRTTVHAHAHKSFTYLFTYWLMTGISGNAYQNKSRV